MVTLASESLSSEDWFETKIQTKLDKFYQIFEQSEEELMDFIENSINNQNRLNNNWLLSTQEHRTSQKIMKW